MEKGRFEREYIINDLKSKASSLMESLKMRKLGQTDNTQERTVLVVITGVTWITLIVKKVFSQKI